VGTGEKNDLPRASDGPKGHGYGKSHRLQLEISSTGIDEALQGVSSDPFPANGYGTSTGLRIPAVLAVGSTPVTQPRYLFCLASTTFQDGIKLLGIRQALTLGVDANEGVAPERPIEMWVTTPDFRFVDGNVSWHLVIENQLARSQSMPATNAQSWAKLQSDSPAMLYQTFTNSNITTTGAPVLYIDGLTAYTPPDLTTGWQPVAGCGNLHDIRFPWNSASAWRSFGENGLEIEGGGRLSLYASVLQSNPATRGQPTLVPSSLSSNACPEECFIQDFTTVREEDPTLGPVFWRIMGSLLVEKTVGA
jgi:hypothetical protein